jgi:biliverdin reductase
MTGLTQVPKLPLQIGLVGTGYAAKLRAEALQTEERAKLVAIAGRNLERAQALSTTCGGKALQDWRDLIADESIDLVVIATINRDHGAIANAAIAAGKHVIVEYPLALNLAEAEAVFALAKAKQKLLHVEHIELLGSMHQTLKANLHQIEQPFYARYATIAPQRPAPQKWTYEDAAFGFPLVGALSRLHRFTDLFGEVTQVYCQAQFQQQSNSPYYTACLCTAQLRFATGLLAEVIYAKGETLWEGTRRMEIHGQAGALVFDGDTGTLIQQSGSQPLAMTGRKGLFTQDTTNVLDHLLTEKPLYVTPNASLYALKVAEAAQRSAQQGQVIYLTNR